MQNSEYDNQMFTCPRCGITTYVACAMRDELFGTLYCVECAGTFHKPQFGMNPNDDGYDFDDSPGAF